MPFRAYLINFVLGIQTMLKDWLFMSEIACNGNLYRSSDEKVIAGVCAGLAHKLDLNMSGLRWVVVLVTLFLSGIPAIVYIVLWAILKPRPTGGVIDV